MSSKPEKTRVRERQNRREHKKKGEKGEKRLGRSLPPWRKKEAKAVENNTERGIRLE